MAKIIKKKSKKKPKLVLKKKVKFSENVPDNKIILLRIEHSKFTDEYDEFTKNMIKRELRFWDYYKPKFRPITYHRARPDLTYIVGEK